MQDPINQKLIINIKIYNKMKTKFFILLLCLNSVALIAQGQKYDLVMHGSVVARNFSSEADCNKEMWIRELSLDRITQKCEECKCVPAGTYTERTPLDELGVVVVPVKLVNEYIDVMFDALTGYENNTPKYSQEQRAERAAISNIAIRSGGNTRVATIPQKEHKSDFSKAKGGYGVMENLGKNYGLDFSKYVPKGLWDKVSKNMGAMSSKEISQFNLGFSKFMSDLFKSDKDLQLVEAELGLMMIDMIEIGTSTALDLIKVSSGGTFTKEVALAKGFLKFSTELTKACYSGKDIKDPKVWWDAAVSGGVAAAKSFVNTGSKPLDIALKAGMTGAGEELKGKSQKEVALKTTYSVIKETTKTITVTSLAKGDNKLENDVVANIIKGAFDVALIKGEYVYKNLKNNQDND